MNSEDSFKGPVNLGNPSEFTILELAENHYKSGRLNLKNNLQASS